MMWAEEKSDKTMKRGHKSRVAVGLSGGVDSSVAAALVKEMGYEVLGLTMEIYDSAVTLHEAVRHACYGPGEREDVEVAGRVCRKLGIRFHVIDLRQEYRNHVIDYFRRGYLEGKTPNPCVVCNQKLKFGFLIEKARAAGLDFDYFATGHYARATKSGQRFVLQRALDRFKDQTYFLYGLTQEQLSGILFPLGSYTKKQVRQIARTLNLETAERRESQDFIAGGDYLRLFSEEEVRAGEIVDQSGKVLGKHRGIMRYTIGQRRGLGIASSKPLYVVRIDARKNQVVVSHEEPFSQGLIVTDLNLIALGAIEQPQRVEVKIRLQHRAAPAMVFPPEIGLTKIVFQEPQPSVTPGQSAVLYSGDIVYGGGVIQSVL
jgi:tRNA-specific 2-thiouridylase